MDTTSIVDPAAKSAVSDMAQRAQRGHSVDLAGLTHRYGSFVAVDDVSLSINAGEIVALLGPSGCGKTTLLRIISGFISQTTGSVMVDGSGIDHLPPNLRNIGIVFQSYALFPHMTVEENVAYGLRARGRGGAEVRERVRALLEIVQLDGMGQRLPRQLSGGQQQRVALARALAPEPTVLLLDEPFSALDKSLRLDMQIELKRLQRQLGLTAILVTHDQDEAMSVSDRIAVMNKGRIEQLDTPVAIYDRPASLFVSGFIGTTNSLAGRVSARSGDQIEIELEIGAMVTAEVASVGGNGALVVGDAVVVAARPEQLTLFDQPAAGRWPVERTMSVPLGAQAVHELRARNGEMLKVIEPRSGAMAIQSDVAWCGLRADAVPAVFPLNSGETKAQR
ncbi:MAG: ABC transporter ATP-binding protein [Hyphomicrobiaceae bacterium]